MLFKEFLISQMKIMDRQDIQICIPKVPQQPNYADCGLYTVQYIKQIIENPDVFQTLAKVSNALESWFDHSEVRIMRSKIAELVQSLSKEQRQHGGLLEGENVIIPDINFNEVCFSNI